MLQSWCFGEDQARIIIATKDINKVQLILRENDVDFFVLGEDLTLWIKQLINLLFVVEL